MWNIYQNDLTYDFGVNLNIYTDDHQFYAMSSDIEVVNYKLTQSAIDALELGILLISSKATLISIEFLVAS